MPARYHDKCFYIPENAIDPRKFTADPNRAPARVPIRVVFIGRLVPYKGADMLVEAAAPLIREGVLHVTIIGNGPQQAQLEEIISRAGIARGIDLAGWLDHTAIAQRLQRSDVLAFPSIREFGGGVALEAMAVGVVPIVVNYGGPAELVTPATGYLVEMGSRAQIIERFNKVLTDITGDPVQLSAKSALSLRRATEQFTWDAKAAQVLQVYRWLKGNAPKPAFPIPTPDPE